MSVNKRTG